jgi:hypothetical protein
VGVNVIKERTLSEVTGEKGAEENISTEEE